MVDAKVYLALCLILLQVAAYQIRVCDIDCHDALFLKLLRLIAFKQKAVSARQLIAVEHVGMLAQAAQEKAQCKARPERIAVRAFMCKYRKIIFCKEKI